MNYVIEMKLLFIHILKKGTCSCEKIVCIVDVFSYSVLSVNKENFKITNNTAY